MTNKINDHLVQSYADVQKVLTCMDDARNVLLNTLTVVDETLKNYVSKHSTVFSWSDDEDRVRQSLDDGMSTVAQHLRAMELLLDTRIQAVHAYAELTADDFPEHFNSSPQPVAAEEDAAHRIDVDDLDDVRKPKISWARDAREEDGEDE